MQTTLDASDRGETVSGVLVDADYVTRGDGRAWVRLWLAGDEGRHVVLDPDFEPYFYALPERGVEARDLAEILEGTSVEEARVVRTEVVDRRLVGEPVEAVRVVCHHPGNVPPLREKIGRLSDVRDVVEADVPYAYRYIIDRGLRPMDRVHVQGSREEDHWVAESVASERIDGTPDLKVLAFDLEVYNPEGVPKEQEDPIVICSVARNFGPEAERDVQLLAEDGDDAELIRDFVDLIASDDPDVIVTYNGDSFDWPYLLDRAELHGIELSVGRDGSTPRTVQTGPWTLVRVAGRSNVDLYRVVERDIDDVKVKTLEAMADHLGVMDADARTTLPKDEIAAYWDDPDKRETLVEYARDDARSTLELGDKLLPLQMELARHVRQTMSDVSKMGRGRQVEWYLRAEAHEVDELVPNKGSGGRSGRYEGGFVLDPRSGVHEDIVCLDFSAMYPSIMMAYNISPDTLVENGGDVECHEAPEVGHRFQKTPDGFFKRIIRDLVETRSKLKSRLRDLDPDEDAYQLLDIRQRSLKILTNSFYGYMGWPAARWYRGECAEATSAWGRHLIQQVMESARDAGFEVYYGDSVTADRYVTVRDPDGMVQVRNVQALFQELARDGASDDGDKVYVGGRGWEALSMDPVTREARWAPIRRVMRHDTDKMVYRVRQKFGQTRVTEDHSVMVRDGDRLVESRPTDLDGRSLVRVQKIPPGSEVRTIDLLDHLGGYETSWEARGRTRTARIHEVGDRLAFGWSTRSDPVTVPRYIEVGSPEFEALLRLIGAYVSEGSSSTPETTDSRMGASIATEDTEWLEHLKEDYRTLFDGALPSIVRSTRGTRRIEGEDGQVTEYRDRTQKLQMMNKLSAVFFRELCGQRSDGKRLPPFVFNVPPRYQRLLLEEMIRGDGSRAYDDRYTDAYKERNFEYTTTSLALASGLSLLLEQLGRPYTIQYRASKGAYQFKTSSRFNARVETTVVKEPYEGPVFDLEVEGTSTFVDSLGQILLHNTDSLFIDEQEGLDAFVEQVNADLPLDLEVDAEYDVIFFTSSKKRYAGLTKDGRVVVKGLEVRRGDWCDLAKQLQQDVIDIILRERDADRAVQHVRDVIERVRTGDVEIDEIAIHKTLTMRPKNYKSKQAHAEAVRRTLEDPERDYEPTIGAKVGYVVLDRGGDLLSERSELLEFYDPDEDPLDYGYYVEKQLLPAAMRVLEHFDVSEEQLLGEPEQQGLEEWF